MFELMKVLEKENITQKECINYFKKNKYLLDKNFDEKVKAEFFEMSAIPNPQSPLFSYNWKI